PTQNRSLQKRIGEEHLLLSQFAVGSKVSPGNFPLRNRTMALLSDATIIIEAGKASGTQHQGWEVLRLGRPLFILNTVIEAGFEWAVKMLNYGAILLTDQKELYEFLPIHMDEVSGEQAFCGHFPLGGFK
ncbi:MAG: DNA-processing protein DprA, partial [Deltaproteobacteria bacterium]